jgi:Kef-type K+ transport system membrane component KefB
VPEIDDLFHQIAVLLVIAAVVGALATRLRQPLIVGFIAVGILVGPAALGIVGPEEEIELLAQMGIALLLFVVGLKLDLRLIRTTGPVAVAAGLGQVGFTSAFGFLIALALGLDPLTSLYVAVALTFSSTIIIVKLLSDKREIDDLHGRIAVGILIVQDIVVVFAMIGLTAVGAGDDQDGVLGEIAGVVLKGIAFLAAIGLLMRYALTPLLHRLARSPELVVLFAIAWAVALAASGDVLGFSKEVGAFLAGVSLASTPYREIIGARLVGLRDFLLLFFFIELGAQLDLARIGAQLGPAVVFSAFVLIGNPLIVMAITGAMGFPKRVGFLCGLTVAQISEFSLILAALGLSLGHIDTDALALITTVGLITITGSTYLILYSHQIYERIGHRLPDLVRRRAPAPGDEGPEPDEAPDVIVFGLGRYGGAIAGRLREAGRRVLAVDFDPGAVERSRAHHHAALYGDVEDPELPGSLPLAQAEWVVSTIPRPDANVALLHALRHHGYEGRIAVTAHHRIDAEALRQAGADRVLMPFEEAAEHTAAEIFAATDASFRD